MKLLHFSDFHLRLTPPPADQFHMQPFWPGTSAELFSRIKTAAAEVDAIVFTGDATHGGGEAEVHAFIDLLADAADGKPVFLVLGNHDVTDRDWPTHFEKATKKYPNFCMREGLHPCGEVDLLLINNQYLSPANAQGHRSISENWRNDCFPIPAMSDEVAERLDSELKSSASAEANRPAIVMIHCPVHVPPATLVNVGPVLFDGMLAYRNVLNRILDAHPRVRMVLSGHVHFLSTQIYGAARVHSTVSSIVEYPFMVCEIDLQLTGITSRLFSLTGEFDPSPTT